MEKMNKTQAMALRINALMEEDYQAFVQALMAIEGLLDMSYETGLEERYNDFMDSDRARIMDDSFFTEKEY